MGSNATTNPTHNNYNPTTSTSYNNHTTTTTTSNTTTNSTHPSTNSHRRCGHWYWSWCHFQTRMSVSHQSHIHTILSTKIHFVTKCCSTTKINIITNLSKCCSTTVYLQLPSFTLTTIY